MQNIISDDRTSVRFLRAPESDSINNIHGVDDCDN